MLFLYKIKIIYKFTFHIEIIYIILYNIIYIYTRMNSNEDEIADCVIYDSSDVDTNIFKLHGY